MKKQCEKAVQQAEEETPSFIDVSHHIPSLRCVVIENSFHVQKNLVKLGVSALLAAFSFLLPENVFPTAEKYTLFIFMLAACLWATEAIPLYATALTVIALEVVLLGTPGGVLDMDDAGYKTFLNALSSPIIFLMLGGFLLAQAAHKHHLDINMTRLLLKPFSKSPRALLLGIMSATALFSMWMSNTATTAMMLAIVMPIVLKQPKGDPFRTALLLAVPFAANIGGMGTPIGSPPNAVAVGQLRLAGLSVSFLQWMAIGVPFVVIMLLAAWLLIYALYKPKSGGFTQPTEKPFELTPSGMVVYSIFGITVLMWLTETLHGLPSSVVALFPAVVLTAFKLLDQKDFNSLDWNILILVAGGISLGKAIELSGLGAHVVAMLSSVHAAAPLMMFIFLIVSISMSTFMSNTATANLLIPLAIGLPGIFPQELIICIALVTSNAMALPSSTPPNAMAFASGDLHIRHMMKVGGILSVGALLVIYLLGGFAVRFILGLYF